MKTLLASCCTLEPLVAAHAHDMFPVLSDPALYEFENSPPPSEHWLKLRYELLENRGPVSGEERWLNWVVRLPSGELAGYVQATVLACGMAHVAYELGSRHWRQGIGSSAVQAMLEELRANYQVHSFFAVLKVSNFRSEALLKKLGFSGASAEQQALHRDGPDEMVMFRSARNVNAHDATAPSAHPQPTAGADFPANSHVFHRVNEALTETGKPLQVPPHS